MGFYGFKDNHNYVSSYKPVVGARVGGGLPLNIGVSCEFMLVLILRKEERNNLIVY